MDVKFFESLTKEETQKFLDDFLHFGRNRGMEILGQNIHFTIDLDFRIGTLATIIKTLIPVLKTIPREPDLSLPKFIRDTDSYQKNLFDFDEPSKSIVLASGYYLGETFIRTYHQLSWATGKADYAEENMPVVKSFKYEIEMAPIWIMENMFGRVISGMGDSDSVDTAIEAWKKNAPSL